MLATETRIEIEHRALEIAAEIERQTQAIRAEIDPDCIAAWHVAITRPGMEADAARGLIDRQFGIYDPMFERKTIIRGRRRIQRSRLLPGYLLVFVWNIQRHRSRITSTPGIVDILCRSGTDQPAIVPDDVVNEWQGKEVSRCVAVIDAIEEARQAVRRERARARKARRYKKIRDLLPSQDDVGIMAVCAKSYLEHIETLADDERISLFHRAIGLGSQHLPC